MPRLRIHVQTLPSTNVIMEILNCYVLSHSSQTEAFARSEINIHLLPYVHPIQPDRKNKHNIYSVHKILKNQY